MHSRAVLGGRREGRGQRTLLRPDYTKPFVNRAPAAVAPDSQSGPDTGLIGCSPKSDSDPLFEFKRLK